MAGVRHLEVPPEDDGQRLDRWIRKNLPQMPYSLLQKLVRKGQVRVDGKRVDTDTRIGAGQKVRIPPFSGGRKEDEWFRPMQGDEGYIRSLVIYDDGDIVAVNKPHGIASQGGMRIARHIDALLVHLEDAEGRRPRLIHRLDRETSGVLLLARSRETAGKLGKMFGSRRVEKTYWAITMPAPERDEGTVDLPLAKGVGPLKDTMVVDSENGKKSVTDFEVIERAGKTAAFVAFRPRTGRTHQIRAHAAAAGFPILGDEKYGPAHDEEHANMEGVAKRMHLHARHLALPFPDGSGIMEFDAPLPEDLQRSWAAFGFSMRPGGKT